MYSEEYLAIKLHNVLKNVLNVLKLYNVCNTKYDYSLSQITVTDAGK